MLNLMLISTQIVWQLLYFIVKYYTRVGFAI